MTHMAAAQPCLVVGSEGMGRNAKLFLGPLLERTFPHTTIMWDNSQAANLVIRNHFFWEEPQRKEYDNVPYITWSGESHPVIPRWESQPILELNTCLTGRPNEVWFPYLLVEIPRVTRPLLNPPKRWCASYAFSHRVPERERLFWSMRDREPTCYGFGESCRTTDNPFELPISRRNQNGSTFTEFAFNVAMENKIAPRYLTEKIGHSFLSGSVPIYWGDRTAVEDFFNPASFVNVLDFVSPDAAGAYCVELWRDPMKLQPYLDAPIRLNNRLADYEAVRTAYRPWQKPIVDVLRDTFPDFS